MTREQDFASRWEGQAATLLNGRLPYGYTEIRLADYRGVPATVLKKLQGHRFSLTDFSFSDFRGVWLEDCDFDSCLFDQASFLNAGDH